MIIGVDFDGTIVEHRYPLVGEIVTMAIETMKDIQSNGHSIILWTMRHGKTLDDAVTLLQEHEISLFGINENPTQYEWTNSPKAHCNLYIDDAAIGCPLIFPKDGTNPYVNWIEIRRYLQNYGIIK